MTDITELAVRSQNEIERSFAAVLMLNPIGTLQSCGWLDGSRILDSNVRKFWDMVRGQVSADMDGDKASEITQHWILFDANGQNLGRLATQIANVLLRKHKPNFTPGMDTGDFAIVVNCEHIRVTGRKMDLKLPLTLE